MTFTYEMNKLLLVDGLLFALPGLSMLVRTNPQRLLKEKIDSKNAIPAIKDVRRSLGAAWVSMGSIMIAIAGTIHEKAELNDIARFRCISLIFIVYAGAFQLIRKKWKFNGSSIMFLVLYGLLILAYAFLGYIDPMPAQ